MEKEKGSDEAIIDCGRCDEYFCLKCRSAGNRRTKALARNGEDKKTVGQSARS